MVIKECSRCGVSRNDVGDMVFVTTDDETTICIICNNLMPTKSKKFIETATAIGKLVAEKNKAYGDSFNKSDEFLRVLYPDGVSPEQYSDMLGIIRVFDKLMRIATDKDALGENPWKDIAGYGILKTTLDKE